MSFPGGANGWVARERHDLNRVQVLRTADGGMTWHVQYDARDPIATALQFVDADHGWLVGNGGGDLCRQAPHPSCQGVVLATSDGGRTWTSATVPDAAEDVAFSGPLDGWVSGSYGCTGCQDVPTWVELTSDGGRTWTHRAQINEPAPAEPLALLARADATSGWVVSSDFVLSTGATLTQQEWARWTIAPSPCARSLGTAPIATGVYLSYDPSLPRGGWLACESHPGGKPTIRLYATSDLGQSWKAMQIPAFTSPVSSPDSVRLFFIDDALGWLVSGGALYRSSGHGSGWRLAPITDGRVEAVAFISSTEGWAIGSAVWHTTDGGDHWQESHLPG